MDFSCSISNISSDATVASNTLDDLFGAPQITNQSITQSVQAPKPTNLLEDLFTASSTTTNQQNNGESSLLDFSFGSMTVPSSAMSLVTSIPKQQVSPKKQEEFNGNSGVKLAKTWDDLQKLVFYIFTKGI